MRLLIINGPNINMLGMREPGVYGDKTFEDLCKFIEQRAHDNGIQPELFQSNIEGEIIEKIQKSDHDGIIINPAAWTHYSIGILDALKATAVPAVEVHISNIHAREEFRKTCITTEACIGQICGLGFEGYILAMDFFKRGFANANNCKN